MPYLLLIISVVLIGALPLFVQYGAFIFPSDFMTQLLPFTLETKRMLASGAPWWSWNTYFGDNFVGAYSYYTLTSPFSWLLMLLPYTWIPRAFVLTFVLKYAAAFLTSRWYFRKMDVSPATASIGGLLYAFSSYTITTSFYYLFFEPVIVFPVLLVAIERFIRRERYCATGLALAVALTVYINFYFAVASLIAAALYAACRLVEWRWLWRVPMPTFPLWRRIVIAVAVCLVGVAAAAFVLLPAISHLSGGPRIERLSGLDYTAPWFAIDRLRTLVMPQVIEGPTSLFRMSAYRSCTFCLRWWACCLRRSPYGVPSHGSHCSPAE